MKKLIMLLSLATAVILIACGQKQPTENENNYSLIKILNDSNWVEVTDTVDVTDQIKCLAQNLFNWGIVFQSENDYRGLWDISISKYPDNIINCNGLYKYDSTKVKYQTPNINFNERTVLGFFIITGPSIRTRHIYKNDSLKECLFELFIKYKSGIRNCRGDGYYAWVSIPKIPSDYKIRFDTTITYY